MLHEVLKQQKTDIMYIHSLATEHLQLYHKKERIKLSFYFPQNPKSDYIYSDLDCCIFYDNLEIKN